MVKALKKWLVHLRWKATRFALQVRCFALGHRKQFCFVRGRAQQLECLRCGEVWVNIEEIKRRDIEREQEAERRRAEEDRRIGILMGEQKAVE